MNTDTLLHALVSKTQYRGGMLPLGILSQILMRKEMSSGALADYFDIGQVEVTRAINNLAKSGLVQKIGKDTRYGLALDSRTGQLRKTSQTHGVYAVTQKLLDLMPT